MSSGDKSELKPTGKKKGGRKEGKTREEGRKKFHDSKADA